MKKILTLIVILILGWAGSTWFISNKTEELLNEYVKQSQKTYADMGMDAQFKVTDYKKSFLQSTAKTSFSLKTGDPVLDNLFKDIQFNNTISHGPVLLSGGTPSFGTALIHSTLDMDALAPEAKIFLNKLFADKNPLTSTITFDLSQTANYTVTIPEIDIEEDGNSVKLKDGTHLAGTMDKKSLMGTLSGTIGALDLFINQQKITTSAATISADVKGVIAGQMLGSTSFTLPSVKLKLTSLPDPINFGAKVVTHTQKSSDTALQGNMSLSLFDIKAPVDVSDINYSANIKGLQIKGLEQLATVQEEIQKLQSSMMAPNISETEQKALLKKINGLPALLTSAIQNIIKKNDTEVTLKLDVNSSQGKAVLETDTRYIGNGVDINIDKITQGGLAEVMKIVEGTFNFSAPKKMISNTPAVLMMPMLTENGLITEINDEYKLNAKFKNQSVILNDKKMTAEEFIELVNTFKDSNAPTSSEPLGELPNGLIEELSKQDIEELKAQGVPDELIQKINAFKEKAGN